MAVLNLHLKVWRQKNKEDEGHFVDYDIYVVYSHLFNHMYYSASPIT